MIDIHKNERDSAIASLATALARLVNQIVDNGIEIGKYRAVPTTITIGHRR